jgi:hypothetical protein
VSLLVSFLLYLFSSSSFLSVFGRRVYLSVVVMSPTKSSKVPKGTGKDSKFQKNHPFTVGADILMQSKLFELTEQVRTDDPEHMELVTRMYKHGTVTTSDLQQRYKLLSAQDFEDPDSPWLMAPIIVSTNRERSTLLDAASRRYAHCKGTVVFRWRAHCSNWRQCPPDRYMGATLADPCFYEYFVTGADGFLTGRVNKELGLVNARSVVYHSITIDNPDDRRSVRACIEQGQPGSVVTLSVHPTAINVLLDPLDFNEKQLLVLRRLSISDSELVIPIIPGGTRTKDNMTVYGGRHYRPSKVCIQARFPVELAFVSTVHKAEGRTMEKVILALSHRHGDHCDMSYAAIYVALSRVRKKDDIRLLLSGATPSQQWASVQYINNLKPDASVAAFLAGFEREDGGASEDWINNQWNEEKSFRLYQRVRGKK